MNYETIFKNCQKSKKIKKFKDAHKLIQKELETSRSDLRDAKDVYELNKYKIATIQAYYSMFHSARALIYMQGFIERSHICLIAAINELYVKPDKLPKEILDNFMLAKELRESADYNHTFSKASCKKMITYAEIFFKEAKRLIK